MAIAVCFCGGNNVFASNEEKTKIPLKTDDVITGSPKQRRAPSAPSENAISVYQMGNIVEIVSDETVTNMVVAI